jgi:type II secretory pathway component PulF
MNQFRVTLRNVKRPQVSKVVDVEAQNRDQAVQLATKAGFRVALVKAMPGGQKSARARKMISKKEAIKFFRGMSSMLKGNINTADALKYYAEGLPDPTLQGALMNIRSRVEAGMPAHVAFAKERLFDPVVITMVEAGSEAGQLHEAFSSMARRFKIEIAFASKLRNVIMVPSIVILFQIVLFIWCQIGIVPQVEETLKGVGATPDPVSKFFFSMSHFVQLVWPFFIIALVSFIVALFRSANLRNGLIAFFMSKWKLLRSLVMGLRQSAYLGMLQMLYSNGIDLSRASRLSARVVARTPLYEPLVEASDLYETSGLPFAEALKKKAVFDPQVVHMIGIGEKSASLPEQLEMLRDIYEDDTSQAMTDFTQIINLITLLIACILIGAVFAGAMLPIFLMGPRMMENA